MLVGYVRLSPGSRNGTSSKIGKAELSENGGGLKPLWDLSDAPKRRMSFPVCLLMRTRKAFRQFRPTSSIRAASRSRASTSGAGGMEWRVTIELSGADGTKQTHEVARGGGADPHSTLDPLGLAMPTGSASS